MVFAPVTVNGITARRKSDGVVCIYRGDHWIGNAVFDGSKLTMANPLADTPTGVDLTELAVTIANAPQAEWVIRSLDWYTDRGFADRRSAFEEYDRLAAHAAEHGGDYTLLFNGVRVESISRRVD